MSDYVIPLSEQVRDLEQRAKIHRTHAANLRDLAATHDRLASAEDAEVRNLKAQIAAGGTRQEELFKCTPTTEGAEA